MKATQLRFSTAHCAPQISSRVFWSEENKIHANTPVRHFTLVQNPVSRSETAEGTPGGGRGREQEFRYFQAQTHRYDLCSKRKQNPKC